MTTVLPHKNTSVAGNVLDNDTDADDDPLTVTLDTDVSHGSLTLNSDGTFSYTPDTNYTGTDSFIYTIDDGFGGTDTATANITIDNSLAPVGVADEYKTPAGPLEVDDEEGVLDNDTDQSNGTLVAVLVSGPSHSYLELYEDGSFYYMPDNDFVGTDEFVYRPWDDDGPGEETTATIDVTNNPPTPEDDEAETDEDAVVPVNIDVLANDTDPDNDDLGISSAFAANGTVEIDDNGTANDPTDDTLDYTPYADFSGTDVIVYWVYDEYDRYASAIVEATVNPDPDNPLAADDDAQILKNAEDVPIDVLANDYDGDGDTLTVTAVTQGSHGTVAYTATGVTYTPDNNYTGSDTFTYTVSDGTTTDTATVNVTVFERGADGERRRPGDDGVRGQLLRRAVQRHGPGRQPAVRHRRDPGGARRGRHHVGRQGGVLHPGGRLPGPRLVHVHDQRRVRRHGHRDGVGPRQRVERLQPEAGGVLGLLREYVGEYGSGRPDLVRGLPARPVRPERLVHGRVRRDLRGGVQRHARQPEPVVVRQRHRLPLLPRHLRRVRPDYFKVTTSNGGEVSVWLSGT